MTRLTTLALLLALTFAGCDKDNDDDRDTRAVKGKIAIYEFESYQYVPLKCEVDPANSKLRASPIVNNDEIISYNLNESAWQVKDAAFQRLNNMKDGNALAITLNDAVVYYFIYKPNYSSSSCDGSITMQLWPKLPGFYAENTLKMTMGYPGPSTVPVTDRRNTPTLIHELKAQKKLVQ